MRFMEAVVRLGISLVLGTIVALILISTVAAGVIGVAAAFNGGKFKLDGEQLPLVLFLSLAGVITRYFYTAMKDQDDSLV